MVLCARRRRAGLLPRCMGPIARAAAFVRYPGLNLPGGFAGPLPLIPVDRARVGGRLPGPRAIEANRELRVVAPRGSCVAAFARQRRCLQAMPAEHRNNVARLARARPAVSNLARRVGLGRAPAATSGLAELVCITPNRANVAGVWWLART